MFLDSCEQFCSYARFDKHSKNSRVRIDPDLGPRGPDPFLGQFDPESVSSVFNIGEEKKHKFILHRPFGF